MATTFFLGNLDYELLVIRDSEFLQSEHRALRLLAVYRLAYPLDLNGSKGR